MKALMQRGGDFAETDQWTLIRKKEEDDHLFNNDTSS